MTSTFDAMVGSLMVLAAMTAEVRSQYDGGSLRPVPEVHEQILRQEGRWHLPVALAAGDVVVPLVTGGAVQVMHDGRERPVQPWLGAYTAAEDGAGDWTLILQGQPGALCRVELLRSRVGALDENGGFDLDIGAEDCAVIHAPLERGAYRLASDLDRDGLQLEVRQERATGEPVFAWRGGLTKGTRARRWLFVERPCTLAIAVRSVVGRNAALRDTNRRAVGELVAVDRPVTAGEPLTGELRLGDGRLHRIKLRAGELVRVRVMSQEFDAQFDLWDVDGCVHSFDDARADTRDASHTFLVGKSGWHHVLVYSPGGAGSGAFTLRVDRASLPE